MLPIVAVTGNVLLKGQSTGVNLWECVFVFMRVRAWSGVLYSTSDYAFEVESFHPWEFLVVREF